MITAEELSRIKGGWRPIIYIVNNHGRPQPKDHDMRMHFYAYIEFRPSSSGNSKNFKLNFQHSDLAELNKSLVNTKRDLFNAEHYYCSNRNRFLEENGTVVGEDKEDLFAFHLAQDANII